MRLTALVVALASLLVHDSLAQSGPRERIWSSVIFTRYGDRTPYVWNTTGILTPLGANQLYDAGDRFRERYLLSTSQNGGTGIQGMSTTALDNDQMSIVSLSDQIVITSAQAFMQGLYPPLGSSSNESFINGLSQLANGSNILAPLNGYQYADIDAITSLDLTSIWLKGSNNCPTAYARRAQFYESAVNSDLYQDNQKFYQSLQPDFLDGIFPNNTVNYLSAYLIYDYLQYGAAHNSSFLNKLSTEDLIKAKVLADNWAYAAYGNTSASGLHQGDHILSIAGRTLANRIVSALFNNINTLGTYGKMTLLFGGFEPMIALAALSGLASEKNSPFQGIPEYGSSMVFELFSTSENDTDYPATTDLQVRFLFANGSSDSSELISYPLFGQNQRQNSLSLSEFVAGMQEFMIMGPADWCDTCASDAIFCDAFTSEDNNNGGGSGTSKSSGGGGLKPAVAGVIGAIVTLAILGLAGAAVMLLGGVRFYRQRTKKRSELNGFKGGEKLASDQDLSLPQNGGAQPVSAPGATVAGRGHERVGSWELGDQKKAEATQIPGLQSSVTPVKRPSFEEDDLHVNPFAEPVKPHDRV